MGKDERPQGHKGGGKRRRGGDDSEGWSRESGSSDATLDPESEEAKEEPAPLTPSTWGMQESGASRLRMGARASRSSGRNTTSGTADVGERRSRHGAGKQHGGEKGGRRGWESDNPWEWGVTLGAARPPEWALIPTECSGRKDTARPPEWRKILGGSAKE